MRGAGSDRLRRALGRHGLTTAAVIGVSRAATALVDLTRRQSREFAVAIDVATGDSSEIVSGESNKIDLGGLLSKLEISRRYVQIHTHPAGSSFSDADVAILVGNPVLSAMVIFGGDGSAYILSKGTSAARIPPLTASIEWNRLYAASFVRYRDAVQAGRLSNVEAAVQHTHSVMRVLARRLGLRYSRIRGVV
jgi:hypothetical protein